MLANKLEIDYYIEKCKLFETHSCLDIMFDIISILFGLNDDLILSKWLKQDY